MLKIRGGVLKDVLGLEDTFCCTNVLPPHRGGAVPYPMGMGRNGTTDLPRGSTERSPPLSQTVFSLGRPLTGHNWAAPLLINRTPLRRLFILALLLISGNVHPNPGPISNHPHSRYPCSICHFDVGRDSLQCSACLKWVHFLYSSLTRADFRTICAAGSAVGWRCPACHLQSKTGSSTTAWLISITSTSGPPRYPCSMCSLEVGKDSLKCPAALSGCTSPALL